MRGKKAVCEFTGGVVFQFGGEFEKQLRCCAAFDKCGQHAGYVRGRHDTGTRFCPGQEPLPGAPGHLVGSVEEYHAVAFQIGKELAHEFAGKRCRGCVQAQVSDVKSEGGKPGFELIKKGCLARAVWSNN